MDSQVFTDWVALYSSHSEGVYQGFTLQTGYLGFLTNAYFELEVGFVWDLEAHHSTHDVQGTVGYLHDVTVTIADRQTTHQYVYVTHSLHLPHTNTALITRYICSSNM